MNRRRFGLQKGEKVSQEHMSLITIMFCFNEFAFIVQVKHKINSTQIFGFILICFYFTTGHFYTCVGLLCGECRGVKKHKTQRCVSMSDDSSKGMCTVTLSSNLASRTHRRTGDDVKLGLHISYYATVRVRVRNA